MYLCKHFFRTTPSCKQFFSGIFFLHVLTQKGGSLFAAVNHYLIHCYSTAATNELEKEKSTKRIEIHQSMPANVTF